MNSNTFLNQMISTKKICFLFLVISLLSINILFSQGMVDVETPVSTKPDGIDLYGDWKMTFSDEFNDTEIDGSKWWVLNSAKSRNPRPGLGITQWFWRPQNTWEVDGNLVLRVQKFNATTMTCGSVNSNNRFEKAFGYYETRIKIAQADKGTHTAFWFQGDNMFNIDGTGRDGAEVDVFESAWTGDYTKSVIHIDGYGDDHQSNTVRYETPGLHQGYHTFGLLWTPDALKIYYDGELKVTYSDPKWIPQVPQYIWLSDGASFGFSGDNFTREPIGTLTHAYVDYVRVWELEDYSCINPKKELELAEFSTENGSVSVSNNSQASEGKFLRLQADEIGDEIILNNICHPADGYYKYDLSTFSFSAFGQYQAAIEITEGVWHKFEQVLDFYGESTEQKTLNFGAIYLEAGNYNMKFTAVGKNDNSIGFSAIFDALEVNYNSNFDISFLGLENIDSEVVWSSEAENGQYTGANALQNCNNASGGQYINLNPIPNKTLRFNNVNVPEAGDYVLNIDYMSADNRNARITVNGDLLFNGVFNTSGNWCNDGGQTSKKEFTVRLNAGVNTITLYNGSGNTPIFDKIAISQNLSDKDKDGVPNNYDIDDDNDTIVDLVDNCKNTSNTDQKDTDNDGIGDACNGNALNLNNFNLENKLTIYPNPTNGKITVKINNFSNNLNLQIFDVRGKKILTNILKQETSSIILPTGLVKGIYILKFNSENTVFWKKIILN
ncbi:family 16 glycosylhydrolase [uncultured Polaribacter sp.]|uniref:family 16 glycosylhydrolase n=1 Tax=uncultured Polaribacter sp. TaxID=174711 RepID=UPI002634EE51|nr:family 16 glycosylhydrolase [uncultured Polaribacter sp.]